MADVGLSQLSALTTSTKLVTLTVGGNDAGFVPVVAACVQQTNCQAGIQLSGAFINSQLPTLLTTLYSGIRASAPNAHVIVLGYPELFGWGPCSATDPILGLAVRQQLDGLSEQLDTAIENAARATGVTYVDVRHSFAGHGVCGTQPWINGIGSEQAALLHPNTAGQQAYARLLTRAVSQFKFGGHPCFDFYHRR